MDETCTIGLEEDPARSTAPEFRLVLVLVGYPSAPERVGEAIVLPASGPGVVGRGSGGPGDPGARLWPHRLRPGRSRRQEPLQDRALSRVHWTLTPLGPDGVELEASGRRGTLLNGQPVTSVVARPGHHLLVPGVLHVRVERWPVPFPPMRRGLAYPEFPFGEADPYGIVGESPVAWSLRERLAFVAGRAGHVLLQGPSGAGKELAARAIHDLSPRAEGPWVARNAATLPEGLVDAELFGHTRDYPNRGMPARPGLVGSADGGTLFLDEIAELPPASQTHLLRVLDGGEYQRLGTSRSERADLRVIGATNRDLGALKHDLAERMVQRVSLPGLEARRTDVPLIAAHLFRQMAAGDAVLDSFVGRGGPRFSDALVDHLVREAGAGQVRALQRALIEAAGASRGEVLDLEEAPSRAPVAAAEEADEPDEDTVRAALEAEDWVVSRAWTRLGLRNRYQLYRLMRRYGLERSD